MLSFKEAFQRYNAIIQCHTSYNHHIKELSFEYIYHSTTLGIEFSYFFLNIDVNCSET